MKALKKYALLLLMLLVTTLTAVSLFVSVYVFEAQERVLNEMLSAYVTDVAETFIQSMPTPSSGRERDRERERNRPAEQSTEMHHTAPRRRMFFRMFSADPTLESGGLLLMNGERKPLGGSDGAERLQTLWQEGLEIGEPAIVTDENGRSYHVIVKQTALGGYVLVAAAKDNLISSISRVWNFWLVSVMASAVAVLIGIAALWHYLVIPLRRIVEAVEDFQWGKAVPNFQPSGLYEVNELAGAIERSASEAVAKEDLRARYVSDIVQGQEDARRRLARELHDGPLQSVVAAIKRIQLAQKAQKNDAALPPESRERFVEAERISQYAANEIRNYCDELSPSWTSLGITSALEELAERLSMAHGVRITVTVDEEFDELQEECAMAIIRILQEAVSNSVRHGSATEIEVRLSRQEHNIVLTVLDNGTGMPEHLPNDFEQLRVNGHRGLSNMHERVQLLNGCLQIGSPRYGDGTPAGGCRIVACLPINDKSTQEP